MIILNRLISAISIQLVIPLVVMRLSKRVANIAKDFDKTYVFAMERAKNLNLNNPLLFVRFSRDNLPGGIHNNWTLKQISNSL